MFPTRYQEIARDLVQVDSYLSLKGINKQVLLKVEINKKDTKVTALELKGSMLREKIKYKECYHSCKVITKNKQKTSVIDNKPDNTEIQ